jgi:choloylglycine hydrolase
MQMHAREFCIPLKHLVYYFESTISPNLIWVDLKAMDFSKGAKAEALEIKDNSDYHGNVTKSLKAEKLFEFAKVPQKK